MVGSTRTSGVAWDAVLAAFAIALGSVMLLLWIPHDVETGVIVRVRNQVELGDAMAPSVVAWGFLLAGAMLAHSAYRRRAAEGGLTPGNLRFLCSAGAVIVASLLLMRYLGPLLAAGIRLLDPDLPGYAVLRDLAPWKYLGFVAGGTVFISGLMSVVEGRLRGIAPLIGLAAVAVLIAIYDIALDDLRLPPNGDY